MGGPVDGWLSATVLHRSLGTVAGDNLTRCGGVEALSISSPVPDFAACFAGAVGLVGLVGGPVVLDEGGLRPGVGLIRSVPVHDAIDVGVGESGGVRMRLVRATAVTDGGPCLGSMSLLLGGSPWPESILVAWGGPSNSLNVGGRVQLQRGTERADDLCSCHAGGVHDLVDEGLNLRSCRVESGVAAGDSGFQPELERGGGEVDQLLKVRSPFHEKCVVHDS